MIRLENLVKTFGTANKKTVALKNVSLHVKRGEIFGVIGFSGAGKSTLVRCINLLERPDSGKVFVAGTELTALSPRELRHARERIAMIFQHFNLFPSRTVFENVAFPLRHCGLSNAAIEQKVRSLLELVGLADRASAFPSQLSGGQKQRVAIARALTKNPQALLCDEATSALDPQTTRSILTLLKKLNTELGLTIILITHEMKVVKEICSRAAVMEGGKIIEENDVFSIFAAPQSPITKRFTESASTLLKIYELIRGNADVVKLQPGQCIVRLRYLTAGVSEALVSKLSRKFQIDINIIFGDIELIGNVPLGGLVAIISGNAQNIDDALAYTREKQVGVEIISDARIHL